MKKLIRSYKKNFEPFLRKYMLLGPNELTIQVFPFWNWSYQIAQSWFIGHHTCPLSLSAWCATMGTWGARRENDHDVAICTPRQFHETRDGVNQTTTGSRVMASTRFDEDMFHAHGPHGPVLYMDAAHQHSPKELKMESIGSLVTPKVLGTSLMPMNMSILHYQVYRQRSDWPAMWDVTSTHSPYFFGDLPTQPLTTPVPARKLWFPRRTSVSEEKQIQIYSRHQITRMTLNHILLFGWTISLIISRHKSRYFLTHIPTWKCGYLDSNGTDVCC